MQSRSGYQGGELAAATLGRAGWGRSNPVQRSLLLDIFGLAEPPAALQDPAPAAPAAQKPEDLALLYPSSAPAGRARAAAVGPPAPADPVLAAAVEELERGWRAPQLTARPPPEPELKAGL